MFTGIIEEVGEITDLDRSGDSARLRIRAHRVLQGTVPGDSISVDGVCLTAEEVSGESFLCFASGETMSRSTLGRSRPGGKVNLERALALGDRIGGHLVSGHVEAVGTIEEIRPVAGEHVFVFSCPEIFTPYVVVKGSVAVDGVSLTVAEGDGAGFRVSVIPETLERTTLALKRKGDSVNLEPDLILKYVRSAVLEIADPRADGGLTVEKLIKSGFLAG